MLRIRLQRIGKKKQPTYRLIVSEKTKDTQAGSLEILGEYNPVRSEKVLNLKKDRIEHWISKGAQPSATVNNILVKEGIVTGKKQKSVTISNKRAEKLEQKKAEEAEKAAAKAAAEKEAAEAAAAEKKAAEEAAKAEAEAAKAAEAEAPAEETPAEETPAEEPKEEAAEPAAEEAPAEAEESKE